MRAQESASYKQDEHVLNAGGRPAQGIVASSPGYAMTIDSIAGGLTGTVLSSPSFTMTTGFTPAYVPPGEVVNVRFEDATTLAWDAEPSAGVYNVYRDDSGTLPG